MSFKMFPRLVAGAGRLRSAANTCLRLRRAHRPQSARADERLGARAHPSRGRYFGLLVGLDVSSRYGQG